MSDSELKIVLNDGTKTIPVYNEEGEHLSDFRFKSSNVNRILERFKERESALNETVRPLVDMDDDADTDGVISAFKEAEANIYKELDYIFDGDSYKAFFVSTGPLTPIDGEYFFQTVCEKAMELMLDDYQKETEEARARISKYTAAYEA